MWATLKLKLIVSRFEEACNDCGCSVDCVCLDIPACVCSNMLKLQECLLQVCDRVDLWATQLIVKTHLSDTTSSSSCTPWESSENWWPFMLLCRSCAGLGCTPWGSPTCITCPSTTTTASSSSCCPTSHVRSFLSPTLHFMIKHGQRSDYDAKMLLSVQISYFHNFMFVFAGERQEACSHWSLWSYLETFPITFRTPVGKVTTQRSCVFVFFSSVSSALLPHAAAEEKGASRRGHSGEGRLDEPPPQFAIVWASPASASPTHSIIPNVLIFSTIGRNILHCTGPEEPHRWRERSSSVLSSNNRSQAFLYRINSYLSGHIGNMFTVPVLLELETEAWRWSWILYSPASLIAPCCTEKPQHCTHLSEGGKGKWEAFMEMWNETWEEDCKLCLLKSAPLHRPTYQIGSFIIFYSSTVISQTEHGCNKTRFQKREYSVLSYLNNKSAFRQYAASFVYVCCMCKWCNVKRAVHKKHIS